MRIAPSLSVLCAALLSACSMDSNSSASRLVSPQDGASLDRSSQSVGQVFTMSNAVAGNSVLVFARAADGSLHAAGTFATGGTGTGAGLGNQGGLALDESGTRSSWSTRAATRSARSASREGGSLELTDRIASGGTHADQRHDLRTTLCMC